MLSCVPMEDLIARKARIVMEHQANLAKINHDILALATNAIKDKRIGGKAKVEFLNLIKVGGGIEREESTGMESRDRLELARMYFQNADNTRNELSKDPLYASMLKDFDRLLESYRKELDEVDEELKHAEEEDKRAKLLERREGLRLKK